MGWSIIFFDFNTNIFLQMKKLIIILILFVNLQSWTKADDVKDFQIEGISIGDSILDHFSNEFINREKTFPYKNKKYFGLYKELTNSQYEALQVTVNSNYIVHNFSGKIYYDDNISECYKNMDLIEKELNNLFSNTENRKLTRKHRADPTGKSTIKDISYFLNNGDAVQISCTDWSKYTDPDTGKIWNSMDELKVSIYSSAFINFLNNENY